MIIVSNPGTHPEMMRLAGGLIDSGVDVRYLTASSWPSDSLIQRMGRWRLFVSTGIGTNVKRRKLPSPVGKKHVVGFARVFEMWVQVSMRTARTDTRAAIGLRNRAFEKRAASLVRDSQDVELIVGQYTASADIFRACSPSTIKVLNYPIAHHRWLLRTMENESVKNPRWRGILQGHDFTDAELASLDNEIMMADHILVPSSFAAATFLEFGVPEDKISIVPLGCDLPPTTTKLKPSHSDRKLNILFAGQVTQRKGIGYLLQAVKEAENVHLTVAGSCTAEARSLVEEFSGVDLLPSLPREELYKLMRDSDLLVLPSLAEGFPLVAIEAMANGTPCLLSNATFAADLIRHGENGYILDDVSVQSIALALKEIQADREGLVQAGLLASKTATQYSWANYSKNVVKVITDLHQKLRN